MREHYPRPWRVLERNSEWWRVDDAEGVMVLATVFEEHARLIAAAPDLLEAAKVLVEDLDPLDQFVKTPVPVARLKTAIRKAEGKS